MSKTPGFGERVQERLRALRYWRPDGKPDCNRFATEHGWLPSYIYRYVDGETPRGWRLVKLAKDLGTTVDWLLGLPTAPGATAKPTKRTLAGLLAALTIAGVLGQSGTLYAGQVPENIRLIGTWIRIWVMRLSLRTRGYAPTLTPA